MKRIIKIVFLLLLVIPIDRAMAKEPKTITLLPGVIVALSEGRLEPRSIGSYSLRIYEAMNPKFPYDNFITGIIKDRDGSVISLTSDDIDKNRTLEVIVIIQSVGTGSYLSADAYRYKEKKLILIASVDDLAKNADPIQALKLAYSKTY